ncbi:hypothetical protein DYB31_003159 [Aphanomyces astaci]|uniref:WW domain-containing protein n=1 Tax=Aphanomyces astaci TaxID=112090 RepID=A0A397ENK3_APHAT|nr:hypothetical protein DYB31_003159 [Aphanomyces astaci]
MSSGYKGFKSWGGQECPSLKPGESYDARATKFSQMGSNIVQNQATNTAIRIVNPSFEAVTRSHFGHVTKHDYENPARPASRGREIANSRTFLGQTLYQNDFLNFQDEGRRIAALPVAVYAASFDQLATVPNQDPTPSDSDQFKLKRLARDDVKTLLRQVYGKPPTSRILEIYAHMFDACPDGFISWDVFQEAVARLASFLLHQTIKISGQAGWFDFVAAKQMLPGGTPASSHQLDFGTYGSEPLVRPYIGRTNGMASTTTDLFDGTTKATFHIPRYQGFIPQTKYNPTAVAQGDGEQTRGTEEDLRLYHLNNLPGYTGHKPVDSKNVRGEAKSGTDSRTTNGFVYKPHNLMDGGQGDSIVLEEEIDPNYEPTEDEVIEYAKWLGMDLDAERELFWIAREGLKAPLPENWKPCKTTDTGEIYYFNFASGASTWDHPCDEYYRKLYDDHKKKTIQGKKFQDTDDKKKKEKDDIAEILGKKPKKAPKKAPKVETLGAVKSGMDKKPLGAIGKRPSAMRAQEGKSDNDDDDDEEEGKAEPPPIKALPSRKPLGKKDVKVDDDNAIVAAKVQELEAKLQLLEDEHNSQVASLQAKVSAKESQLKQQKTELDDEAAAIEKKLQKLHKDHADEVENVKELDKKLSKRRKDLEAEHREALDNADSKFMEKKRELTRKQDKELKDMDEKHKEALEGMDAAHEKALQRQEAQRQKEEMQAEHREKEESNRVDKLNTELDTLKAEVAQYKRQVNVLEGKLQDATASNHPPELVSDLETSIDELKAQVEALTAQLKQKDKAEAALEDKLKRQAEAFEESRVRESTAVAASSPNKELEGLEEQVKAMTKQLAEAHLNVANAEAQTKDWQGKHAKMTEHLTAWESKHNDLLTKVHGAEAAHASTIAGWEQKVHDLTSATTHNPKESADVNEWREKFQALVIKHEAADAECTAAKSTCTDLKQQVAKLEQLQRDATLKYEAACAEKNQVIDGASLADSKLAELERMIESLTASKRTLVEQLEDAKAAHQTAQERTAQELREAKADGQSWQRQYDKLMDTTNQDQAVKDQLQQWQAKYDELQQTHEDAVVSSRAQIDALECKIKGLERDNVAVVDSWKKKMADAEIDWQRQLTSAKSTIGDLQAKWTSMQSQESSTSGLVASLQEQLDQAYRRAQESQDAMDEHERGHKRTLETQQSQWKQQLDDVQATHALVLQGLKSEAMAAEAAKRKADDQRATLERKLKLKENEVASVAAQMQAQHTSTHESTTSMWEWEKEKLTSQLKLVEGERTEAESRLDALRMEHDALLDTHHRVVLDKDVAEKKVKQVEVDKEQLAQKLKGVEKEVDIVQAKWRALTTETTDLKSALSKVKLGLQTAEVQYEKATEECAGLETLLKQVRDTSDKHQADARALQLQLDDALFQKQRVEHDQLALHHEVDRLKEQIALRSSSSSLTSSAEKQDSLRQQVEQLTADARAANDKVRQLQGKAQEFETKFKQGQEMHDRHVSTWQAEKQSLVDKLDKVKGQQQQLDRQLRTTTHDKDDVEATRDRVQVELADLEKRWKLQGEALAAAQTKLTENVHHIDELEGQKRAMTYELQAATGKLKRLELDCDRTKAELATRSQEKDAIETKWRLDVVQFEAKLKSVRQDQSDLVNKRLVDEESKREEATLQWKRDADDKKKEWNARLSQLEMDKATAQTQLVQTTTELAVLQKDKEHWTTLKQKLEAQVKSITEAADKDRQDWHDQLDQAKTKLKSALAEKDALMLSVASSSTRSNNNNLSMQQQQDLPPTAYDNGPTHLKLQMAQVNKTELETHLHDVTMQCETWRRKAALLDSRSRDLALEIEALHVENAALRASSQRMHTSALESLTTVERLNYEHKKRMVRSEYMAQLREFTEREELAFARQKARVRASCERQLDELVGDFDKQKNQRMNQEERDFQSALHHCQSENQIKLSQVLKEHRVHTKQLNREEDLAQIPSLQPGGFDVAWKEKPQAPTGVAAIMPLRSPPRHRKVSKYSKPRQQTWRRRIQQEHDLLAKAKQFLAKQKKSLKHRMAKLQDEKDWWQRQPNHHTKARHEMKQLLEQHAQQLAHDAKEVKATEKWLVKREQKIQSLERTCNHEGHLERLHDELVADGSTMSAKLQSFARNQDASALAWPSELSEQYEPSSYPPRVDHSYEPFMSNSTAPRTPMYDTKLSKWVHKRERASAAASAHSNYLHQLSQELKTYSNKYQTAHHSEGEVDGLP